MPNLTEDELAALVARKVREHLERPRSYEEIVRDRVEKSFGPVRTVKDNNVLDRMKVMRMTPDEQQVHMIDTELATEATEQLHDIAMARKEVRKAKLRRKPVDPDTAALAASDVDNVKVECIVEQTHIGDGRVLRKGETAHVHEHFAEILERAEHVRIRRPRGRPRGSKKAPPENEQSDETDPVA